MKSRWCERLVFVLMLVFAACFALTYFNARGSERSISVAHGTAYECAAVSSEAENPEKEKEAALRIDLNTATQSELEDLPGIGSATAERIIAYRLEHGGFSSLDELKNISGIGGKTLTELREYLFVD